MTFCLLCNIEYDEVKRIYIKRNKTSNNYLNEQILEGNNKKTFFDDNNNIEVNIDKNRSHYSNITKNVIDNNYVN